MILHCGAVLFDVDGTLVDSTPLVERAARIWAAEYGIDPDEFMADSHGRRTAGRAAGATVLAVSTSHDPALLTEAHHTIADLAQVTATSKGLHLKIR